MFAIELAGLVIGIDNRCPELEKFCKDYVVLRDDFDLTISATDDEIAAEIASAGRLGHEPSPEYAESAAVYRAICHRLPEFGAFLFHSSVVECDGRAYAFAAASGTGKSTHASLWLRHFGDRVRIINGDKPIFRFMGDELRVFGTPWCGKEGYNVNTDAGLSALCFIERGNENSIRRIYPEESLPRIFSQILLPTVETDVDRLFPLLEKMLDTLPCYLLTCDISDEAVTVAYNGMNEDPPSAERR